MDSPTPSPTAHQFLDALHVDPRFELHLTPLAVPALSRRIAC